MIPCGDKYKSCIQTYGSFNDFSGTLKTISIADEDENEYQIESSKSQKDYYFDF